MITDNRDSFVRWFSNSYLLVQGWTIGLSLVVGLLIAIRLFEFSWEALLTYSILTGCSILVGVVAFPKYRRLYGKLNGGARRQLLSSFTAGILVGIGLALFAEPVLLVLCGMSAITFLSFAVLHACMPQIPLGTDESTPV